MGLELKTKSISIKGFQRHVSGAHTYGKSTQVFIWVLRDKNTENKMCQRERITDEHCGTLVGPHLEYCLVIPLQEGSGSFAKGAAVVYQNYPGLGEISSGRGWTDFLWNARECRPDRSI